MKTTFSPERMEYTKRAHSAAQRQFYAPMFEHRPMEFEDTVGTVRDLEYAIDCQLAVSIPDLRAPLRFSVQERWRNKRFMDYGDITITEWNTATNEPSELHKLGAQLFVYGFYDAEADHIVAGVALDTTVILRRLATGGLPYTRRSRIDQSFLAFGLSTLETVGAVVFKYRAEGV